MTDKKLLDIKKNKKAQKPAFLRRNFMKNKRTRVSRAWRAPIGLHNKLRRKRRGVGQWVMPGYRMPCAVRGLTITGLKPIVVENEEQMKALKTDIHCAILKGSSGKKNRIQMVQEAIKNKIHIINLKDPAAFLKTYEEEKAKKQKEKKEVNKEVKVEKKQEKNIEEIAKDQKKEQEKEKNKILTKKE